MAFSCSQVLENIDIDCSKKGGGLIQVLLCRQQDVFIDRDPLNPSVITLVQVLDPVVISFNDKDGETSFAESKTDNSGLGLVTTSITVQIPGIDSSTNKLYSFGLRNDIVAILFHNNSTVTISGYDHGMYISYEADSGAQSSSRSYVNINITGESNRSSIALDDDTVFQQINSWNNIYSIWNNITNTWNTY